MIQTWSWSWRTSSSYLLTHYRWRFMHFQKTILQKYVSWLVLNCFTCVQGYGFPVNRLFDLLFEVRDQYSETLLKKWSLVFRYCLSFSHKSKRRLSVLEWSPKAIIYHFGNERGEKNPWIFHGNDHKPKFVLTAAQETELKNIQTKRVRLEPLQLDWHIVLMNSAGTRKSQPSSDVLFFEVILTSRNINNQEWFNFSLHNKRSPLQ